MISYKYSSGEIEYQYLAFMERNNQVFKQYETFKGPDEWQLKHILLMLELDQDRFLSGEGVRIFAFSDQLLVGTASITGLHTETGVIGVLVDAMFQRQGIAKSMLGQLEGIARKYRCKCVQMLINESNLPSIAMAESKDFYPTKKHEGIWTFEKRLI